MNTTNEEKAMAKLPDEHPPYVDIKRALDALRARAHRLDEMVKEVIPEFRHLITGQAEADRGSIERLSKWLGEE